MTGEEEGTRLIYVSQCERFSACYFHRKGRIGRGNLRREGGKRERIYLARELSWISESGIRDNPNEHDNSSVCSWSLSFARAVTASPPSSPLFFPRLHSNGTGDARPPGENGFAPARTIRSYVSVAAAYMHLLKETRRTRTDETSGADRAVALAAGHISPRDFSRNRFLVLNRNRKIRTVDNALISRCERFARLRSVIRKSGKVTS